MKHLLIPLLLLAALVADAQSVGKKYVLKKVIEVQGRQGIAIDENYYYVSSTSALYKYDKEGNLVISLLRIRSHFRTRSWPTISGILTYTMVRFSADWRNSSMAGDSTLPYLSMMQRLCSGSETFLGVRNQARWRCQAYALTVTGSWCGCAIGWTADMSMHMI